jgi:hypothetical protein
MTRCAYPTLPNSQSYFRAHIFIFDVSLKSCFEALLQHISYDRTEIITILLSEGGRSVPHRKDKVKEAYSEKIVFRTLLSENI